MSEEKIDEKEDKQFIGIYSNAIPKDTCHELVTFFDMLSEHGMTMTSYEELNNTVIGTHRTDEVAFIPSGIPDSTFPKAPITNIWKGLRESLTDYEIKYSIGCPLISHTFKIHRVQPSGGYHMWHHEHMWADPTRTLAWMIVLEAPEKGGETEFLFQSIRVEPKVGQVVMWPAAFTHKHRGNPPLEGQKTYATGWFLASQKENQYLGLGIDTDGNSI